MALSTRQEPVDPAWIDDKYRLIVIDTRWITPPLANNQNVARLLETPNVRQLLDESGQKRVDIGKDRILRLSIKADITPERAWMKIADAYQQIFGRGLEFRDELPPPYRPSA